MTATTDRDRDPLLVAWVAGNGWDQTVTGYRLGIGWVSGIGWRPNRAIFKRAGGLEAPASVRSNRHQSPATTGDQSSDDQRRFKDAPVRRRRSSDRPNRDPLTGDWTGLRGRQTATRAGRRRVTVLGANRAPSHP